MSSTISSRSKPGKFRELELHLRRAIADGTWQSGDRLPSFAELRHQFGMSSSTVSRALLHLEQDGLVTRRPGSGIYVAPRQYTPLTGVFGFHGFSFKERYLPYWMNLMEGIQNAAHEAGFEVLLLSDQVETRWEKVDGVLLHGDSILAGSGQLPPLVPRVAVVYSAVAAPTVRADDFAGANSAVEHLLALGHQRIGYLCFAETAVMQPRLAGYHAAFMAAGLQAAPQWVRRIELKLDATAHRLGKANMEDWLAAGWAETGCTALLVQNDILARGVLEALQTAGIRVPEDVSLVGYDGTEIGDQCSPSLTSVAVPLERIGARAVGLLLQQIHGDDMEGVTLTLPTRLTPRASTAPPRPAV